MIDNNPIFQGLNPEQKEAVEALEGPLLILAGAGSGKTKTLTHRIANLIVHGVEPENILAVTFTNKAAKEMRRRLWNLVQGNAASGVIGEVTGNESETHNAGGGSFGLEEFDPPRYFMPYMGTFHSIAVRILRTDGMALGIPPDFVIYDVADQQTLMKRVIKQYNLDQAARMKPKLVYDIIAGAKNEGQTPEEMAAAARFPDQRAAAQVYKYYEIEKDKAGALDFDDLMIKEWRLLQEFPEIRKKWQENFRYILIDEYQDTNHVQYQIVKLLVGEEQNICAVGDDWQSIYSWRGADFTNILNFERDFPGAKVIKLERNYRSTGNILAAAQQVIRNNKTRTDKTLFTEAGKGEPIQVEALRDETEEANFVVDTIMRLSMRPELRDFANFTILYRTNAQSYAFEKMFMHMQIPYKIVGGVRFYDRKEVKDMLAILKVVENQQDKVSLERVAKNVLPGVGEVSLGKILATMDAVEGEKPLFDPDIPEAVNAAKAKKSLGTLIGFLKKVGPEMAPSEMIKLAVKYFDFEKVVEGVSPEETEERLRNLEVLASNAEEYAELADFLADAMLMSSADESAEKNAVTMMTVHAAKGLEFPVVFLVGMEEGLFPSGRAVDEGDVEEERRLAYVGMTRAMQRLYLTYARSRYSFGGRRAGMRSQFLGELGVPAFSGGGKLDLDGDGIADMKTGESEGATELSNTSGSAGASSFAGAEMKFVPEGGLGSLGFGSSDGFGDSGGFSGSSGFGGDFDDFDDFGDGVDEEFGDDLPVFE